jgi:hypothetical protein
MALECGAQGMLAGIAARRQHRKDHQRGSEVRKSRQQLSHRPSHHIAARSPVV